MPVEQLDLKSGTPVTFRHPDIDRKLVIGTGVSGISWSYNLNTAPTSTYGGEVVQVLSAFVDALTVHGQTTDNGQLRRIADWFLEYMQLAGLHNRDEHFITMEYPERGWSFWLQVTQLPDFHYSRDEIAVEWSVTAEVVADNDLNYLSQMTMSAYTETAFDPSMWDMKFMAHDPRNDPIHLNPAFGLKIGDNFQSLLGAWASGDFAHWSIDATSDVSKNHLKTAKEYWTQIYGTDAPFASSASGQTGTGSLASAPGTSVVATIANAFTAHGVPPELGVAVAMQESGLDPDKYQEPIGAFPYHGTAVYKQTGAGLFQTTNVGGEEDAMYHAAINDQPHRITNKYPAAKQAEFAARRFANPAYKSSNLGQWGWNAQRPKNEAAYVNIINSNLPKARQLIKNANNAGGHLGPGGSAKARLAAEWALSQLGVPYSFGAESPGIGFDCSGLCQWAYAKAGVAIPRTSQAQYTFTHHVQNKDALPGDLVFMAGSDGTVSSPGHVVMYIGGGKCVAADQTGTNIRIDQMSGFLGAGFTGVGRVPNA